MPEAKETNKGMQNPLTFLKILGGNSFAMVLGLYASQSGSAPRQQMAMYVSLEAFKLLFMGRTYLPVRAEPGHAHSSTDKDCFPKKLRAERWSSHRQKETGR
jgi:hypothetical protein